MFRQRSQKFVLCSISKEVGRIFSGGTNQSRTPQFGASCCHSGTEIQSRGKAIVLPVLLAYIKTITYKSIKVIALR